ncbi:MAG: hypothetical protein H7Y86_06435 [Rhizobacter sp.]|nr:hypothetical protein [Ferruginibacter sp.]
MLKTISKNIALLPVFISFSVAAIAQETKKVDIDINTEEDSQWYMQPWAWAVGGAVFVLLLVALLRRNKS